VEKSFAHNIKAFLKEIDMKYGAQLFIMSAYERVDSSIATTKYELFA
jgi:hypothetical protein